MDKRNYGFYDDGQRFIHCFRIGFIKKAISDLKVMINIQGVELPKIDIGSSFNRLHNVSDKFISYFDGHSTIPFLLKGISINNDDEGLLVLFYNKLRLIEDSLKDLGNERFLIIDKTDRNVHKIIQKYLILSDFFNSEGKLIIPMLDEEKEKDLKP